jgi:hypothetical protein
MAGATVSTYVVQAGDTPALIAKRLAGSPTRMGELVRANAHKPAQWVGKMVTFRDLAVGEKLTVPPRWSSALGRLPVRRAGLGQATDSSTPAAPGTASTIVDALSGWGVPLAVGLVSAAAGFGLASVISGGSK